MKRIIFLLICITVTGLYSQVATPSDFPDTKLTGESFREELEGLGTAENPYLINTIADLIQIGTGSYALDRHYLQNSNIDASATLEMNDGTGFNPIGYDSSHSFTGSYNGQGYTISNLYINRPTNGYVALFGSAVNAVISNVGLVDIEIIGSQRTGGLVGQAQSTTISNCYSRGIVTGTTIHIGGLVGAAYSSFISSSYSTAIVSGDFNTGGLVGYDYSSIISNSYATGTATVTSSYVGGLVALSTSSTISNSYSTGHVSGSYDVGGLIGYLSGSSINNSFWDINTSGQTISAGGTGKTTQEMKNIETYLNAGWDFIDETANGTEDIWSINLEINSGYPYLIGIEFNSPQIVSFSPNETEIEAVLGSTLEFSVVAIGINSDLTYKWYVNQEEQESNTDQFSYKFTESLVYEVKVVVSEDENTIEQAWSITIPVSNDNNAVAPLVTAIVSNYPNPFNPETTIRYSLSKESWVNITIYDLRRRVVRKLYNGYAQAGIHNIVWNGFNSTEKRVASGIYYVRMQSDGDLHTQKITLMK